MPKELRVSITAVIPVHATDAMQQAQVTQAMRDAAQAVMISAQRRGGSADVEARIVSVKREQAAMPLPQTTVVTLPQASEIRVGHEVTITNNGDEPGYVTPPQTAAISAPPPASAGEPLDVTNDLLHIPASLRR